MTRVRFHRAASAEVEAAMRWYNDQVPGERVVAAPLRWPTAAEDPRTRRCSLSRFPYSILFVVSDDGGITVAAVAHGKRRPGYWRRRIER